MITSLLAFCRAVIACYNTWFHGVTKRVDRSRLITGVESQTVVSSLLYRRTGHEFVVSSTYPNAFQQNVELQRLDEFTGGI